jgi:hypothetical protein
MSGVLLAIGIQLAEPSGEHGKPNQCRPAWQRCLCAAHRYHQRP